MLPSKNNMMGLVNHYKNYVIEIAKPDYQFEEDIRISAEVAFDSDKFNEFVGSLIGEEICRLFLEAL